LWVYLNYEGFKAILEFSKQVMYIWGDCLQVTSFCVVFQLERMQICVCICMRVYALWVYVRVRPIKAPRHSPPAVFDLPFKLFPAALQAIEVESV